MPKENIQKTKNSQSKKPERKTPLTENTPLSPKQRVFCEKYVELNNGAQAILEAGYKAGSINSASTIANRLLHKVEIQNEIQTLRDKVEKHSIATAQEVMEYFTRVMNGEEKDQFGLEAPLSERTKAAQELAKRTVDLDNRLNGKADAVVQIKLDWSKT